MKPVPKTVKLPKVGSNAIVPAPVDDAGPNKKDGPNFRLNLRAKFKIGNALWNSHKVNSQFRSNTLWPFLKMW